jgi:hypothetical protein
MGFYWTTYLYYGKILNKNEYDLAMEKGLQNCIIKLNNNQWMYYREKIEMANLDPVLGKEEIEQKFVEKQELERWFSTEQFKRKEWSIECEKETPFDETLFDCRLYIIQTNWSTLDDDLVYTSYIDYNLPVQ